MKNKSPYFRNAAAAPECIVKSGFPEFGCFNTPFHQNNLIDTRQPYALPLPHTLKNLQLREWQAFQLGNERYFIMMAIYNAKKMGIVQFIVYDRSSNEKIRYEKKVLPGSLSVPDNIIQSEGKYRSRNFSINAVHDLNKKSIEIRVDISSFNKQPNIKASFNAIHDPERYEPMAVSLPFNERRGMYSYKSLMPMEGRLQLGDSEVIFNKKNASMIIDDHKGYYPFPTRYDWVTGRGIDAAGVLTGFNLTKNQVVNPERYNENCLWYDGVAHLLPPVQFERPQGYKKRWVIRDDHGMVDLEFMPLVHNQVNVNLLLFKSRYEGPYGLFNGRLMKKDGRFVEIKDMLGMGEDFYLRI